MNTAELLAHLIADHDGTPAAELRDMTHAELVAEHRAECALDAERGRPCPLATISLRNADAGSTVTITHEGHPRNGQQVTVVSALDRGDMRNAAGFNAGIWVLAQGERVALWADTQVTPGHAAG